MVFFLCLWLFSNLLSIIQDVDCDNKCLASSDSFSDYGQFHVSQSGVGHIMISAPTALSTMDFSMLPLDHGVVDSPPKQRDRVQRVNFTSPLKTITHGTSYCDSQAREAKAQRKLYEGEKILMKSTEVVLALSLLFILQFCFDVFS